MVSTTAGTVGQGVPQASLISEQISAEVTAALSSSTVNPLTRRSSVSSSTSCSIVYSCPGDCIALQSNLRGLRANINDLKFLIADHEPCVIALQETKVGQHVIPPDFIGKQYTLLLASNTVHYWQHGVGLAIREGIPFERVQIDTTLHLSCDVKVTKIALVSEYDG